MSAYQQTIGRRGLLAATAGLAATALLAPAAAAATGTGTATGPATAADGGQAAAIRALERAAQPLRSTEPGGRTTDLRALSAMIGDAQVVGLGEATHGSHEFFAMKERVFRHLVEEQGFTTFALEMSWTAGLRIDEYLQGGAGDARRIAGETLAGSPWEREEFVSLIAWMRWYNDRHPGRKVHFMGNDIGAPRLGDAAFERVLSHARTSHPQDVARLEGLYAGLRPLDDAFAYLRTPVADRRAKAATAQQALDLVTAHENAGDDACAWAAQHARNIAQTFAFASLDLSDPQSVSAAEHLRDRVMADNTTWWHRRTGHKMLLSAHNGHVGYLSTDPVMYPTTQGVFLRNALGRGYAAIGFTFGRGSFLTSTSFDGTWSKVTVPAATPDMQEYTLGRVRHRDYYLDLRTLGAAGRSWLDTARPVHDAGSTYTNDPMPTLAIGRAYDVLIHLDQVHEATKL
ncbi:erythromycin esterase family protein [Streptomyces sp. NBC_00536]|uniref:erythromycin esterase family protein n=1 Tax=Streptomyces sp. NBC_00536 TaxID=2975769 RepID=UPI002E7FB7B6|nr:erythromycin esterase family protein [Streptomyces sp. NBC_00536]WUC77116.1 erythromycin esterase family protein [Streptomyces sp. NBC_00536]